jgi:hypothetical protein
MCCIQAGQCPSTVLRPSHGLTVISGHALLITAGILPRMRWSAIDRYQAMPLTHGLCLVRELIDVVRYSGMVGGSVADANSAMLVDPLAVLEYSMLFS